MTRNAWMFFRDHDVYPAGVIVLERERIDGRPGISVSFEEGCNEPAPYVHLSSAEAKHLALLLVEQAEKLDRQEGRDDRD